MGTAKSRSGKGSGWHLQSQRHSNARKTGKAGGSYANKPTFVRMTSQQLARERVLLERIKEAQKELDKLHQKVHNDSKYWNFPNGKPAPNNYVWDGKGWIKNPTIKDSDGDGVADNKDCEPHNPDKQGVEHEKMRKARIEKQLNKKANFGTGGTLTYKQYFLNHVVRVEKVETDNTEKFNRTKYNRMDNNKDQDLYMAKLEEKVIKYRAYNRNGSFININKLLYEGFLSLNNGLNLNLNEKA